MIELIKPYDGNEVGTVFPLMGRGAARLLVQRGYAKFINDDEQISMEIADETRAKKAAAKLKKLQDETTKKKTPVKEDADETKDELASDDTTGSGASQQRGRKKAT